MREKNSCVVNNRWYHARGKWPQWPSSQMQEKIGASNPEPVPLPLISPLEKQPTTTHLSTPPVRFAIKPAAPLLSARRRLFPPSPVQRLQPTIRLPSQYRAGLQHDSRLEARTP